MEHPNDAKIIIEKSMTAARARVAARRARELTRRKGGLEITNYWGKLTDCSSKDATISEMFIVEEILLLVVLRWEEILLRRLFFLLEVKYLM